MIEEFKSGFVSIIGRPNVGKSTLINSLIGKKILSTSLRPQFTRRRVNCILTLERGQIIFIDTPGINRPLDELGQFMLSEAYSAFSHVDLLLFVVDATSSPGPGDAFIARKLEEEGISPYLIVNKIDALKKGELEAKIQAYSAFNHQRIVPVSAKEGSNIQELTQEILHLMPPGPKYYPEEMVTDLLEEMIMADMIREKVFLYTREEIPYAVEVQVVDIQEREEDKLLEVYAVIFVERNSQKGIIIGAQGQMLKRIGQAARARLEEFFKTRVYLDLWVKVRKDWRDREDYLRHFGYRR